MHTYAAAQNNEAPPAVKQHITADDAWLRGPRPV